MIKICYKWGNCNVHWIEADWFWSQCKIIPTPPGPGSGSLQPPGVDATVLIPPWMTEPWNPYRAGELEKKKRLIKLICKVKGQTYEEEKEVGDMKVSVDDIKMVIKAISDADVDVKLEE